MPMPPEPPREVSFTADPGRLDTVVARRAGVPRADVQRAIARGQILVDGRPRPKSHRLSGGEQVEARLTGPGELAPEPGPLKIPFQDDHLLVVSKPAGLVTHPTTSRRTGTLVNRLLARGVDLSTAGGEDRPGIVHRLDAGTSGLMVVAKDDATHAALAQMFRRHEVHRVYLALVRGGIEQDRFLIEAALERRKARIRLGPVAGKEASTEVSVAERLGARTLVEARPRTGRTHQIRVHLSAIGHPVLGDRAYGGGGDDASRLGLSRPFLHSWRIAFTHPITGERIEAEDPLPEDLARALVRAQTEA
jgi:23S rRNA pseudouridine1911/1915/1917 synthase